MLEGILRFSIKQRVFVILGALAMAVLGAYNFQMHGLAAFEAAGFQPFEAEWRELDVLEGRQVTLQNNGMSTTGIARGIDADGGLVLEIVNSGGQSGRQIFHAGEVSGDYA